MQEHRFDDLTRSLGRAASRRQVLKGLVAGLGAAVVGRRPSAAEAATRTCSSTQYRTCIADAKTKYDALNGNCATTAGPAWAASVCSMAATAEYQRLLAQCHNAQCPPGMACINDRCCVGATCCTANQIYCPGSGSDGSGGTCCPAGSTCCESGCCPADKTCCLNFNLTFFNPSALQVCTDLQTDVNNCGACRNKCDGLPCTDGNCQCAPGDTICKGPLNQTCCHANEYCQGSAAGGVTCVPRCSACEVYDSSDPAHPCKPKTCPTCQECDPQTGQCAQAADGTECGSNLVCRQGQCVAACSGECTVYQNGQCVPAPNGTPCGGSYVCCNGACYHNPGTPCCDSTETICADKCCPAGQGCAFVAWSDPNEWICCPVDAANPVPGNALPGGACCPPGSSAYHMISCPTNASDTWICCPDSAPPLYGCCAYG